MSDRWFSGGSMRTDEQKTGSPAKVAHSGGAVISTRCVQDRSFRNTIMGWSKTSSKGVISHIRGRQDERAG